MAKTNPEPMPPAGGHDHPAAMAEEPKHATATVEATPDASEPMGLATDVRKIQCDIVITKHVSVSLGAGFIPVPVFDFVTVTGVQVRMLYQLCEIYGVPFSKEAARSVITSLIAASLPALPARMLASALKMIPGAGTALGMFTAPTLYGATTYAVGRVFVQHLESGGTLLTFDAKKMKAHFERALRRGHQVAAEAKP